MLAPNRWDESRRSVSRIQALSSGQVVQLEIAASASASPEIEIKVEYRGRLGAQGEDELLNAVRRMFRLDEDLTAFYARCRAEGAAWVPATRGLGRLLRSPTVFEDLVRTICTTNIAWGGTKRMVQGLVDAFGAPFPLDPRLRAFPTAEALASAEPQAFSESVRLGYRGPYIRLLAERVVGGDLDLEALVDSQLPTLELRKQLLQIKGVGSYAAATMLMLLGRYDELPVDSVFRQFVSRKYFNGEDISDARARAVYDAWGAWKYLAYWFDVWQGFDETL